MELRGDLGPKSFGILDGPVIERLVIFKTLYVRLRGKLRRRGEDSVLVQDRTEIGVDSAGFHDFYSVFL
jgi:hypothetical protein